MFLAVVHSRVVLVQVHADLIIFLKEKQIKMKRIKNHPFYVRPAKENKFPLYT